MADPMADRVIWYTNSDQELFLPKRSGNSSKNTSRTVPHRAINMVKSVKQRSGIPKCFNQQINATDHNSVKAEDKKSS